jgi:4-amino-4-deoxy-L-arabinose transferase-like glycosyltransferase
MSQGENVPRRQSGQQDNELRGGSAKKRTGDVVVAIILALFTAVLLLATAPDIGLTWDEPTYIVSSENYMRWLSELLSNPVNAISREGIQAHWEFNSESPPFSKFWSGLFWVGTKSVFDDLTAHRLGNILLASLLVALVYVGVATSYGRRAGLAASASLLTMPRFFFHSHLASLDVPVTTMTFAAILAFWWLRERPGLNWSLMLGLIWGVGILTKINALVIVPIVLSLWIVIFRRELMLLGRLVIMGLSGFVVAVTLWPWMYHDTLGRLQAYLDFMTVNHYEVVQYYFGHFRSPPPWHFPFVMTLVVVPLTLTLLYSLGAVRVIREKRRDSLGWLLILGAAVSLIVLATGRSQVFDNERLLMPVFPFLAALAGTGLDWALRSIRDLAQRTEGPGLKQALPIALVVIAFAPQAIHAANLYPHLLSYYSEGIAGLRGARRLRLETTYWCESYHDALEYLNTQAPDEAVVWAECRDVLLYYQLHGRLRSDLHVADGWKTEGVFQGMQGYLATWEEADFAVIQNRESGLWRPLRYWVNSRAPLYRLTRQNVQIMGVYAE